MPPSDTEYNEEGPPKPKIIIAVPARIGSTRLKNKPLASLGEQPLIVRVVKRVQHCLLQVRSRLSLSEAETLALVATDCEEIQKALKTSQIRVEMSPPELPSGTDRVEYVIRKLYLDETTALSPDTLVVNLQGDEPFFCIEDVLNLIQTMEKNPAYPMGTLAFKNNSVQQFLTPSCVKVVRNHNGDALYFTRSPVPWPRSLWGASEPLSSAAVTHLETDSIPFLQHVGVYAFRLSALQKFTKLEPSRLELAEGLEQLRALEAGWKIIVVDAADAPFGIDTEADLARASAHLHKMESNL
jgi:3-deoxy-manno-octulosonate cytidylyltransferase (CMP-KDO synthetase)